MSGFVPAVGLGGGHRMTLYGWAKPRRFRLPAPEMRHFDVESDTKVLAHCYWQPERHAHPALLALHGLEGSSQAHYMRGLAEKGLKAGFSVVLLNQRNCGGTEQLSPGLYHSGLTSDVDHLVRELADADGISRMVVAGYSLGGNLALKLAGEYGNEPPAALRGVCAVSPILEISACTRALERRTNVLYQWNFVRALRNRMLRKERCHPGRFALDGLDAVRTVRQFDEMFTAPHFGFRDAEDYYVRASAMRVIDRVSVPALIIAAEDDPFVPIEPFLNPIVEGNRHIRLVVTRRGGHCGFISNGSSNEDIYWAENRIIEFSTAVMRT